MRILLCLSLVVVGYAGGYGIWPDGRPPEHPVFCKQQEPLRFDEWVPMKGRYDQIPLESTELCPSEQAKNSVVSRSVGQPTRVFIQNSANEPVDLYWVGFDGAEEFIKRLAVNETVNEKTSDGHVFHARAISTKELLMRHTVGVLEFTNKKNLACPEGEFKKLKTQGNSPLECSHISKVFKNSVGCPINIFFWNGTHEELVSQMGTAPIPAHQEWDYTWQPSYHFEATYLTHRFYIRLANGRLIEERRVGKVPIVNCPLGNGVFIKVKQQQQLSFKIAFHHDQGKLREKLSYFTAPACNSALEICHHEGAEKYAPPSSAHQFTQEYLLTASKHLEL